MNNETYIISGMIFGFLAFGFEVRVALEHGLAQVDHEDDLAAALFGHGVRSGEAKQQ